MKISKENIENTFEKAAETLTKELESLSNEGLHQFFKFVYTVSHIHGNVITLDKFEEFLSSFDDNPFKINNDQKFRKQLIENIIKYAHDPMSLITIVVLIKKRFTIDELTQYYYSSIDLFDGNWF